MIVPRPKFILCDMDGTLIDTEGLKCEAWRRAVADVSGSAPDESEHRALYEGLVGRPGPEMAHVIRAHYGLQADAAMIWQSRETHRRSLYEDSRTLASLAMTGVIETVARLREGLSVIGSGAIVLVTTASEEQLDRIVDVLGIGHLFDRTISGLEKSADNPACYEAALSALECAPEECLAIEDTVVGYEAARSLGIPCLLLPNEFTRNQRL